MQDDSKNKKGLAEVYEASILFKKLCLKLEALTHFKFTHKPVIEEMSVQTNVPAIAMEEVVVVAVADATMLALEEIFSGKGDIKDEYELTQEERKRRKAKKKKKFKAESVKQSCEKGARYYHREPSSLD